MIKYFDLNNERLHQDLMKKYCVDLQKQNEYHMYYGHYNLTCIQNKLKRKNIEISGIVQGGLRFTLPSILPDLPSNHPDTSKLNISKIAYNFLVVYQ